MSKNRIAIESQKIRSELAEHEFFVVPILVRGRGYAGRSKVVVQQTLGHRLSPHVVSLEALRATSKTLPADNQVARSPQRMWRAATRKVLATNFIDHAHVLDQQPETNDDLFARPSVWHGASSFFSIAALRPVATFVLTSLILISPLRVLSYYQDIQAVQQDVVTLATAAVGHLDGAQHAAQSLQLDAAADQFAQAHTYFNQASQKLQSLDVATQRLLSLVPATQRAFEATQLLLLSAEKVSNSASRLSSLVAALQHAPAGTYFASMQAMGETLRDIRSEITTATAAIAKLPVSLLPAEHQSRLLALQQDLPAVSAVLHDAQVVIDSLLTALGNEQWQRYLVVFTNDNELRGVGGFMGSFAFVDIDRGAVKKIDLPAGGTYDIKGQLTERVIAPEPLHLINPRWEFQDANWWPHFPSSAKKMQWFVEHAGGPSTDGVILLTSTFVERILAVSGPIEMPDYGRTITSDNFEIETQKIVELEYDKVENKPKQFLADLAPLLLERLLSSTGEQALAYSKLFKEAIIDKQAAVYASNPDIQDLITRLGWDGGLRTNQGDYLLVAHTNLAGGKTDAVMQDDVSISSRIRADGSILNTVTLKRMHRGVRGSDPFTGVQNNSYVRFYVPLGSQLIDAQGFDKKPIEFFKTPDNSLKSDLDLLTTEVARSVDHRSSTDIYQEHGKTVFGNWVLTPAGETRVITITYLLPASLSADRVAEIYLQKQVGAHPLAYSYSLVAENPYVIDPDNRVSLGTLDSDALIRVPLNRIDD